MVTHEALEMNCIQTDEMQVRLGFQLLHNPQVCCLSMRGYMHELQLKILCRMHGGTLSASTTYGALEQVRTADVNWWKSIPDVSSHRSLGKLSIQRTLLKPSWPASFFGQTMLSRVWRTYYTVKNLRLPPVKSSTGVVSNQLRIQKDLTTRIRWHFRLVGNVEEHMHGYWQPCYTCLLPAFSFLALPGIGFLGQPTLVFIKIRDRIERYAKIMFLDWNDYDTNAAPHHLHPVFNLTLQAAEGCVIYVHQA